MLPNVDGHYLPMPPRRAILTGRAAKVPLLIGTTHDEGSLFAQAGAVITGKPLNNDTYKREVARYASLFSPLEAVPGYSEVIGELAALLYPLRNYPTPPGYDAYESPAHLATGALLGDALFACSAKNSYTLTGAAGFPTYAYEFNDPSAPLPIASRVPTLAFHTADASTYSARRSAASRYAMTPAQVTLSNRMQSYWGNFARTGRPERAGPAGVASLQRRARPGHEPGSRRQDDEADQRQRVRP